ncbi:MAG: DUF3473 domain-containing protein [Planctomycetota bacterium]|jgi:polysaccharide deacetylase family protein (PEP-CTERM system associated)
MMNAFTVDVEDYYSVFQRDWLGIHQPPAEAVVRCTGLLLEMLAARAVQATFFFLGEVAERFPKLPADVVAAGHEIGVHGYYHRQLSKLKPAEFRKEVADAKKCIEDAAGTATRGHRAAAFSIGPETKWGLEVLAELGFVYDSSVFPFGGRRYGWPGFGQDIQRVPLSGGMSIIEAPLTTFRLLGKSIPVCGGGYIRHFPYWFTRWAMRRSSRRRPVIVYAHPYELDTLGPPPAFVEALAAGDKAARRHHRRQLRNRPTVEKKLRRLLEEFSFRPLGEVIDSALGV